MIAFLAVIGIFVFIGMIGQASEPKCIKSGCDNKQASGSSYCYLHKPYSSKFSSSGTSVYNKTSGSSSKSSSGGTNSYTGNTGKTSSSYGNSSTKKNTYESYDDGYDDIYMDGDYDDDRYRTDSDYADGVDDAIDEFGEDW